METPKASDINWPIVALAGVAGVVILGVGYGIYSTVKGVQDRLPGGDKFPIRF